MIYCSECKILLDETATRCSICGRQLLHAPRLRGAGHFDDAGLGIQRDVHTLHLLGNLRNAIIMSVLAQVVVMYLVASVRVWWHFLVLGFIAALTVLIIHKFRFGHLICIGFMMASSYLAAYLIGFLEISHFVHFTLAMWLLGFYYAYLGHHLKLNQDLHS